MQTTHLHLQKRSFGAGVRCGAGFSVVGGLFGSVVLILVGHQLARGGVVQRFGVLLAVSAGSELFGDCGPRSFVQSAVFVLLGLLFSTVGLSAVHTQARFTFGFPELYEGINFIPAMIGLFGVSEVLKNFASLKEGRSAAVTAADATEQPAVKRRLLHVLLSPISKSFVPAVKELGKRGGGVVRSSAIGTAIGMLPGAGADIASWVSLAVAKRLGSKPTSNRDPSLDGFAEATTANNAALAGAWIPALVFGIPGDSVTAIVIGVLLMKNVKPGRRFLKNKPCWFTACTSSLSFPIWFSSRLACWRSRSAVGGARAAAHSVADHPIGLHCRFLCHQ